MAKQKTTNIIGRLIQKVKDILAQVNRNTQNINTLTAGGGSTPTWKDITHTYMDDGRVPPGSFIKISGPGFFPFTGTFDGSVLITMVPFTLGPTIIVESKWVTGTDGIQIIRIKVEDGTKTIEHHRVGKFEILE